MSPRDLSISTVTERLNLLREFLAFLDTVGSPNADELQADQMLRFAVERVLTQLVDTSGGLNQHLASSLTQAPPGDLYNALQILVGLDVISAELAEALRPSIGLRNILVHEYLRVDLSRVAAAIPLAREHYAQYVHTMAAWVLERS